MSEHVSDFFRCPCGKVHMKAFPGPTRACSCGEPFPSELLDPHNTYAPEGYVPQVAT